MTNPHTTPAVEEQIDQWRSYLRRRQAIKAVDIAELEDHLREQIAGLTGSGLSTDEAFLVAVKRMGDLDSLSREFALEHSERLWKQLVVVPSDSTEDQSQSRNSAFVAFAFAVGAAVLVKIPALFGYDIDTYDFFYARNVSLFVLPLLAGYFAWKRRLDSRTISVLAAGFVVALVFANIYPFIREGSTQILSVIHLPIALWLLVGIAYAAERWNQVAGRMDFIRFSGELFIYYVLIALGGGVLMGFTAMMFEAIGIDIEGFFENWLLPCGALGAVIVASWLVEAKQSVIENMAPVLTRLFTPLFTLVLLMFLVTIVVTGRGIDIERNVLIGFDLLLIAVLGLVLYSISARDPKAQPGVFDVVQLLLVMSALAADAVALSAILARITEFGFSPNRVAGLGINVILLVNLAWTAVLCFRFLKGRGAFGAIERWQTNYLPVYAAWAAIVVIAFPVVFNYR